MTGSQAIDSVIIMNGKSMSCVKGVRLLVRSRVKTPDPNGIDRYRDRHLQIRWYRNWSRTVTANGMEPMVCKLCVWCVTWSKICVSAVKSINYQRAGWTTWISGWTYIAVVPHSSMDGQAKVTSRECVTPDCESMSSWYAVLSSEQDTVRYGVTACDIYIV